MELGAANMLEHASTKLPVPERLVVLRRHQAAWRDLVWTRRQFSVPYGNFSYDLSHGVYAQGHRGVGCDLTVLELPSNFTLNEGETWGHDDLRINMNDFAIDSTQNLLIIACQGETAG